MKKLALWFSPERRQTIQIFAVSLAPLLILAGISTEGELEQWLILLGLALQFVSNLLSLVNLRFDISRFWTIVRGAIYTLGMGAAPVLVALGVWTAEFSASFTIGLGLTLAALGNAIAIFTGKNQELTKLEHKIEVLETDTRGTWRQRQSEQ